MINKSFPVELYCDFPIEVAHYMPNFPEGHPNKKIHGHSYVITVVLKGPVDPKSGVLVDIDQLKKNLNESVQQDLDHNLLNTIAGLEFPTSENIAYWIWRRLKPLYPQILNQVQVARSTVGMKVIYRGENFEA
jgi:6-pyruvoyltetrahydropterin/6-carboxytetrahydropterin synthase